MSAGIQSPITQVAPVLAAEPHSTPSSDRNPHQTEGTHGTVVLLRRLELNVAKRVDPARYDTLVQKLSTDPTPEVANLGQRHLRPAPAGSYPAGAAPSGARQLIGDVWEWTSSDFRPYPGFVAWPYKEYSEVFFGPEYKVLRGGAFGVSAVACRGTFRNWDYPIRRQIFAGFRTARSAPADTARSAPGDSAGSAPETA